jgi:uncharacterized membrane protein
MVIDKLVKSNRPKSKNGDSNLKSILKTISWRILGTLDTILIAFFITGKIQIAISIGSIEVVTKMILYYFHERVWNKINLNYDEGSN